MIGMTKNLENKRILLIISGGIAAYKSLELIRLLRKNSAHVNCILTNGGAKFVTALSIESLSGNPVHTDLWSPGDTGGMAHINLSRNADLIVVAPASANMIARMANGLADDLASATLLAADKPVLIAPAMNHKMWTHPATQENLSKLRRRGVFQIGPNEGDMACNETGPGRMAEPEEILKTIEEFLSPVGRGRSEGPGEGQEETSCPSSLAERLKFARTNNNLTQEDISKQLNISAVAYGAYERGRNEMSLSVLAKIAKILNVSTEWLINGPSDHLIISRA
jgi:phosphopantothenoylcysteine decarboxylase/phosphopantothenate--cysteine ligase